MAYADFLKLKAFLGKDRVENLLPSTSVPYLNDLLEGASGEIDSALSGRYSVPIDTSSLTGSAKEHIDELLAYWTVVLAGYRGIVLHAGKEPTKALRAEYERILKTLQGISLGFVAIPYLDGLGRPAIRVVGDTVPVDWVGMFATARAMS